MRVVSRIVTLEIARAVRIPAETHVSSALFNFNAAN